VPPEFVHAEGVKTPLQGEDAGLVRGHRAGGAENERLVALVSRAVEERRGLGIGARHEKSRHPHHVELEAGRVEPLDLFIGGNQDLAPLVPALLGARSLVLDVVSGNARLDETPDQIAHMRVAAMPRVGIGDDERAEVHRRCAGPLFLAHAGAQELLVAVRGEQRPHQHGGFVGHLAQGIAGQVRPRILRGRPLGGGGPSAEVDPLDAHALDDHALARGVGAEGGDGTPLGKELAQSHVEALGSVACHRVVLGDRPALLGHLACGVQPGGVGEPRRGKPLADGLGLFVEGECRRCRPLRTLEIEVGRDARAVAVEGVEVATDALLDGGEVVHAEGEVEQVDVPGGLVGVNHDRLHDGPRQGQRCPLRVIVDVAIVRHQQLGVLLLHEAGKQLLGEWMAGPGPCLGVVLGPPGTLVQPLPENADADFSGGHVLHEIQHVLIVEKVGWFEGCGLKAPQKGVAVLQGHAQEVAGPADRAWCGLEPHQPGGIGIRVGQGRKHPSPLVQFARLFPDRAHDVHHLPVRHPLAARPGVLLPGPPRDCLPHSSRDPVIRSDRDVGFHAALPKGTPALAVGGVDRAADPVLVDPHVAIGHADRVDVRVGKGGIPRQGIGHGIDVVPAPGVEADEVTAEDRADLQKLERGLDLLHQDVDLDRALGETEVLLERRQQGVPDCSLFGRLDLWQIKHHGAPLGAQRGLVVHHVKHHVDDRGGEASVIGPSQVAVVEVQPPGPEDSRGEFELLPPIGDDRTAKKPLCPAVHLGGDRFGNRQEEGIPGDCELQVALIVKRHGVDLAQSILAVEHPAIGAGEEGIRDVAEPLRGGGSRPGGGPGPLDPLAFEVARNLTTGKGPGAGVSHENAGSRKCAVGGQELQGLPGAQSFQAAVLPLGHHAMPLPIEAGQRGQCVQDRGTQDIRIGVQHAAAELKLWDHRCLPSGARRPGEGRQSAIGLRALPPDHMSPPAGRQPGRHSPLLPTGRARRGACGSNRTEH